MLEKEADDMFQFSAPGRTTRRSTRLLALTDSAIQPHHAEEFQVIGPQSQSLLNAADKSA